MICSLLLKRITPKWVKQPLKRIICNYNNFVDQKCFVYNGGIIDCVEFRLTKKCNYKCEYCDERFSLQKANASDETIDSFLKFLSGLHEKSVIKLTGGEPTFHPRFIDVAHCIMKHKHNIDIGTNFSLPNELYMRLIDCSERDNQIKLMVSLHLSQIKSIPDFIEKLVSLKEYGKDRIFISVASVLLEDNVEQLKYIREDLRRHNIKMGFQRLKIASNDGKKFYSYTDEVEKFFIEVSSKRKSEKLKDFNPFGMLCKAGYSFVRIDTNGEVYRCYNSQQKFFNLGNINEKWKLLKKPMPCLSDRCTCLLPINRGLLMFDKYNKKLANRMLKKDRPL